MEIIAGYVNLMFEYPTWTSTAQVMVHFPRLLQLKLFNGFCPDFGTVRGLVSKLSLELFCSLL